MKKKFLLLLGSVILTASLSGPIAAQSSDDWFVSITNSPIHLFINFWEFTTEFNLKNNTGIALITGFGSVDTSDLGDSSNDTVTMYEFGAQFNYYAIGGFDHGLQLGVELAYLGLSGNIDSIDANAAGLSIGPYIGYKVIWNSHITFNAQLGYQWFAISAEGSDGSSASGSDSSVLLNLNVGVSF